MRYRDHTFLVGLNEYNLNTVPLRKRNRRSTQASFTKRPERIRAKVINDEQLEYTLAQLAETSSSFESDQLKLLLSVRAGLRAGEIAALTLDAFLDADGRIAKSITVEEKHSKSKRARTIPMHPDIRIAVKQLLRANNGQHHAPIAYSYCGGRLRRQSPNTLAQWFRRAYRRAGLTGCSSHSGRRTFVTTLARRANQFGHSLRDVQYLAGHANLDTTAAYIDLSPDLTDLIRSLGHDEQEHDDAA